MFADRFRNNLRRSGGSEPAESDGLAVLDVAGNFGRGKFWE